MSEWTFPCKLRATAYDAVTMKVSVELPGVLRLPILANRDIDFGFALYLRDGQLYYDTTVRLSGVDTPEVRGGTALTKAAGKYARDQAIYRQSFFQLEIDTETGTISVMDMDMDDTTNTGQSGGASRRSFELPAAIRIGEILPDEEDAPSRIRRFLFSPDGGSEPFQVVLENPRRKVQVSTDPLTGFPKVTGL